MSNNYKTLYLCYFGLRQPLVQTQVLPYLREIVKSGIKVSLLTFETEPQKSWTPEQISEMRSQLKNENIDWHFLTYHKRPSAPATLFDILHGAFFAWRLTRREKIDILHARVHTPAMMGALAKKFSFGKKPKLLFDIRGFLPEEYTEGGVWNPDGLLYKTAKKIERWVLKESDGFVVLTERAKEILFPEAKQSGFDKNGRPIEVIPCCVDLKRFDVANEESRAAFRKKLNIENRTVAVYVGSLGGTYLTNETAEFFGALKQRRADTFAMVLTQSDPKIIEPLLKDRGFNDGDFLIRQVTPKEIPLYLSAADAAISFIKAGYAKLATSPTKNAEYLACGLPIIANDGVGDTTWLTKSDETGIIMDNFADQDYQSAIDQLEHLWNNKESLAQRCRTSARNRFELENVGGERYRRIYRKLLENN